MRRKIGSSGSRVAQTADCADRFGYTPRVQSEQLYAQILGITQPWQVSRVALDVAGNRVDIHVRLDASAETRCPECQAPCSRHDTRTRRWRHLDTCQMQTILIAEVPRISCSEHGVRQVTVPWAERRAKFTAMFEALIIDWLKQATISAVADRLGLTWDQVDGVMKRGIGRGLERRETSLPKRLGVDEKSFQKRHEYVTVVHDIESGTVIHVDDTRKAEGLESFFRQFSPQELSEIEVVTMDMSQAYISAVEKCVPGGREKIAFDRFHIAALFSKAIDEVRRREHRNLMKLGDKSLAGSRYQWLTNPKNMTDEEWKEFESLRESTLKTARAYAIKETAMEVWEAEGDADFLRRAWGRVMAWAGRSRLEPMKKLAKTLRRHLDGVIRAQILRVSNATAEGLNSVIQQIKYNARGFRNRERFKLAILFHLGGLDLYPRPA